MNKIEKLMYTLSFLTITSGVMFGLVIIYWMVFPYRVIEWNSDYFPIVTKTATQGGSITFIADYCKYRDMSATISRSFINDIIYTTPESTTQRQTGCHVVNIVVPIPQELPPGNYYIQTVYKYDVNPIRSITLIHNTDQFTVVEAGGKP
ncbi:MAG: hypothetical protein A2Y53_03890 [Chloroflexi bacterium RBG_16_47_49]|nr:MAG: hypothetical protein A2Y53_03890 [Chloroflexi bacterium RBG_16_47_49]